MGGRQQGHLNTSGETAGIGHMLCLGNVGLVDFGQTIDIIVLSFDAEVLCQINDLDMGGDGVFLQESLTLTMSEAEEDDIHLIKGHFVRELQVRLADESLVYVRHQIAGITL